MEKTRFGQKLIWLLKSVLASYIVTGLLLLLISFLVYKFQLEESLVDTGIMAIYLMSTFTGGFLAGKLVEYKKFLWGMFAGILYIGLLYAVSYILYGKIDTLEMADWIHILLCAGGGMLGGMMA